MPSDTSVKFFDSSMAGAPALSGVAGSLIGVLDACLVSGFGGLSVISSLSVVKNVATAITSTPHGFTMMGTTGPVVAINGCPVIGIDGQRRVSSVINSVTFTFETNGVADGTIPGTISVRRQWVGWEKRHSGDNKAVYARTDIKSTSMLLRIDDTPAQFPTLTMYESMSDVDTGTGSSTLGYTAKSSAASGVARPWALVADQQLVYLFVDPNGNGLWASGFVFGDLVAHSSTDIYACLLLAHSSATTNYHPLYTMEAQLRQIARSYSQIGGSVSGHWRSFGINNDNLAYRGTDGLNPGTNGMHVWPLEYWEGVSGTPICARGWVPGIWNPMTKASGIPHGTVYSNFQGLPGRDLRAQTLANASYRCLIDITGPWR